MRPARHQFDPAHQHFADKRQGDVAHQRVAKGGRVEGDAVEDGGVLE